METIHVDLRPRVPGVEMTDAEFEAFTLLAHWLRVEDSLANREAGGTHFADGYTEGRARGTADGIAFTLELLGEHVGHKMSARDWRRLAADYNAEFFS